MQANLCNGNSKKADKQQYGKETNNVTNTNNNKRRSLSLFLSHTHIYIHMQEQQNQHIHSPPLAREPRVEDKCKYVASNA